MLHVCTVNDIPANIYLFKVNNKNPRKRSEICLTVKHRNDVNDVVPAFLLLTLNISYIFLVFLLLTLNE